MKVKLYEARWLHNIEGDLAYNFHKAIEDADIEGVRNNSIALLEKCKEFFDPEEQDYVIYEIEDLIESFRDVDDDEDEVDFLLDELYDFCDGYNIFINLEAEPEVKEDPVQSDDIVIEPENKEDSDDD